MQLGICHSSRQRSVAQALAGRLERNLGVRTLPIEDDTVAVCFTWEQASASDAVLLLLDAITAPGPVNRGDWASLLDHTGAPPVALIRVEPCHFPKLLERGPRFLSTADALEAVRWVERWLVELLLPRDEAGLLAAGTAGSAQVPAEWWTRLVDRPGDCAAAAEDIDAAQAFAREARRHFQGVFWIGCEHRPPVAILDEIAHWARGATRLLFILVHAPAEPLDLPVGRHSYLVLAGSPPVLQSDDALAPWVGVCQASGFSGAVMELLGRRPDEWAELVVALDRERGLYRPLGRYVTNRRARQRHLEELSGAFDKWRMKPDLCRQLLGEAAAALRYGFESNSPIARQLCLELALFLQAEKRNPEAVGWLRVLEEESERHSDVAMARRACNEISWLVDDSGSAVAEATPVGEQLGFDFGS